MTPTWAIDTGVSQNACALARVWSNGGTMWRARVWSWQGATGSPLRIEGVVGPEVARLLGSDGVEELTGDSYYAPELRRGMGDRISLRVQGGELIQIYSPTKRLVDDLEALYVEPVGYVWNGSGWEEDARAGERVTVGFKAVERRMVNGKPAVSLPELGKSHHDEAVAVMRALWAAGAGKETKSHGYGAGSHRYAGATSLLEYRLR